jgi:Domain of unknown function (DUF3854)
VWGKKDEIFFFFCKIFLEFLSTKKPRWKVGAERVRRASRGEQLFGIVSGTFILPHDARKVNNHRTGGHIMPRIKHQQHTDFIRVSPHQPCPICERDHWCYFIGDMTAVVCMRVESDRPTRNGEGWIHILEERHQRGAPHRTFTPQEEPSTRADSQTLNRVYRDFHLNLSLSDAHRKHLIAERGLTPEEIRTLNYRTMPPPEAMSEWASLINPLAERYGLSLLTVPGFYLTDKGKIWMSCAGGLLVPCKDVDGNIVGNIIRLDNVSGNGKYRWVSAPKSKRKRGGVSSGTPIHVAGREYESKRVWITEGVIKADIASLRLKETVVGIVGVSSWKREELCHTLQKLGVESVVIAFDADVKHNRHVEKAQRKLAGFLLSQGYIVYFAQWNIEQGKGIDDLLVNGLKPTIRRYYPPVDVDDLKSIGGALRVRRVVIPTPERVTSLEFQEPNSIDDLRVRMQNRIRSVAQFAVGGALLIKGTQGLSKSTSTIAIVHDLWMNGQLRPVFSIPRHDLADPLILPEWLHLYPRKPHEKEALEMTPAEGHQYIQMMFGHAAHNKTPLDIHEMQILCPHWKRANAIAGQRWNVVEDLCVTDCAIGTTFGTAGCPYFMQYRSPKPLATVHETLFIPKFCEEIFGNQQLPLYGVPRQVCIIDEPNPSKFYETVDITPDDLSRAIVDAWEKPLKELLDLVRRTAENVASRLTEGSDAIKKRKIIGREVMQELVDFAGPPCGLSERSGQEKLEKLLKDAKAEAPSKHEKVIVGIDAFISERQRSYEVVIGGETRFLPKALADPIDNESIKVVKGYALKEGFPIQSSFEEGEDGDIPLNFCTDLLWALNREFQLYQSGVSWNSALVFTVHSGKPIVRLNLRKEIAIPAHVPLILLDAQGNAFLLSRLLGRNVEAWESAIALDADITQLVDGSYGITSLWNRKTKQPKSSLKRLLNQVVFPLVRQNPGDVLIVTWKRVADYLRSLQEQGELSPSVAIEHYGNIEGSNEHEQRKIAILLGTPQVSPDELEEMAHALFQNDEEPISMETEERWERYPYRDCNGHSYEVKQRRYVDERVELLSRLFKEDELVQAAHRVRPLLHEGRHIYLLTNLPLNELPPTRLVTLDALAATLDATPKPVDHRGHLTFDFFNDFTKGFLAENGVVWLESLKPVLQQTLVKMAIDNSHGEDDQRQSSCDLPSDSTLKRWLKRLALSEGWNRSTVTVEHRTPDRGGGATWILVYHEEELDEYQVRADYAQAMGIGCDDLVTVEPLPWTDADRLDIILPFRHERHPKAHPPPQRE